MTFINNIDNTDVTVNNTSTTPANPSTSGGISPNETAYYILKNVMQYVIEAMNQAQEVSSKNIAVQSSNLQETMYTEQAQAQLLSKINYENLSAADKETLDDAAKNDGKTEMTSGEVLKDWWQGLFSKNGTAKDGDSGVKLIGNIWNIMKNNPGESIIMGIGLVLAPFTAGASLALTAGAFVGYSIDNEVKTGTMLNGSDKDIAVDTGTQTDTSNITTELTTANQDVQKQRDTISNDLTVLGQQQSIQMTGLTTATQTSSQNLQQIGSLMQLLVQISSSITAR